MINKKVCESFIAYVLTTFDTFKVNEFYSINEERITDLVVSLISKGNSMGMINKKLSLYIKILSENYKHAETLQGDELNRHMYGYGGAFHYQIMMAFNKLSYKSLSYIVNRSNGLFEVFHMLFILTKHSTLDLTNLTNGVCINIHRLLYNDESERVDKYEYVGRITKVATYLLEHDYKFSDEVTLEDLDIYVPDVSNTKHIELINNTGGDDSKYKLDPDAMFDADDFDLPF